jgi:hypothetical protein
MVSSTRIAAASFTARRSKATTWSTWCNRRNRNEGSSFFSSEPLKLEQVGANCFAVPCPRGIEVEFSPLLRNTTWRPPRAR